MRENEERREHTEDGARPEPRRLFYLRSSSYEAQREPNEVTIPDHVMVDFGSPVGSSEGHDGSVALPKPRRW